MHSAIENGWFNVSFDNKKDCEMIAQEGFFVKKMLIQCERANVQNSAVVYVKAPYEMDSHYDPVAVRQPTSEDKL